MKTLGLFPLRRNERVTDLEVARALEKAKAIQDLGVSAKSEKQSKAQDLIRMKNRITDAEGVDEKEAMNLIWMHEILSPGAKEGKVSIKEFKNFLETVVEPADPAMYKKCRFFFNLYRKEGKPRKEDQLFNKVESFLNRFRTVENAFKYNIEFRNAAIAMAPKLDAPEDMSVIDRVKWIRIWVVLLMDQVWFWGDFDEKSVLVDIKKSKEFEQAYMYPDDMVMIEEQYCRNLEDGEIILDMIKALLNLYPEDIQKKVMRWGEFEVNSPDTLKLQYIRSEIKRDLFPHQWIALTSRFCLKRGIMTFSPEIFQCVINVYKTSKLEDMPKFIYEVKDPFDGFKRKKITAYTYMEIIEDGVTKTAGVTCEREFKMYIEVYKWLQKHPEFLSRLGVESLDGLQEDIEEEIEEEEITLEDALKIWILKSGLASSEENINWDLVYDLVDPEENMQDLEDFLNGEASEEVLLHKAGFKNKEQAKLFFNLE